MTRRILLLVCGLLLLSGSVYLVFFAEYESGNAELYGLLGGLLLGLPGALMLMAAFILWLLGSPPEAPSARHQKTPEST